MCLRCESLPGGGGGLSIPARAISIETISKPIAATDEFTIYRAWDEAAATEALAEFQYQMHDGAEAGELSAGLLCFDFLCLRGYLSDCLLSRVEGATAEARIRIEMLRAANATQRSDAELCVRAIAAVSGMG